MAAEGETGRTDCVLGFFLSSFIRRKPMRCLVHIYIYIYIHRKQMGAVLLFFFFSSSFFFFLPPLTRSPGLTIQESRNVRLRTLFFFVVNYVFMCVNMFGFV